MQVGSLADLGRIISLRYEILALHPLDPSSGCMARSQLALSLHIRFPESGSLADLESAISEGYLKSVGLFFLRCLVVCLMRSACSLLKLGLSMG